MRDLTPVLDVLAAAEEARDPDAVRRAAVDALAQLLPCDRVVWTETADDAESVPAQTGSDGALSLALPVGGAIVVRIALHRAAGSFDDAERALVARLRPALAIAARETVLRRAAQSLTAREAEVLRRVADGESNDAVGLALGISRRTVEKHLEHVYRKLGVAGRYAAIASARSSSTSP